MNAFDLGPLLRTGIGFERINRVLGSMAEDLRDVPTYPPYNIEKTARDHPRRDHGRSPGSVRRTWISA